MVPSQLWADSLYRRYRTSYVLTGQVYWLRRMLERIEEVMPYQQSV